MGRRPRKTDPCPCGSGAKYKYCHGAPETEPERTPPPPRRLALLLTLAVATPIVLVIGLFQATSTDRGDEPAATPDVSGTASSGTAPPGKVWSEAHGHWHDDPQAPGAAAPVQAHHAEGDMFRPEYRLERPPGEPPPGKVWSEEHGHWHDTP